MKICPYCGKENPDDATVCSLDRTHLDPDVPVESQREASRAKTVVDLAARPFTVTFAVQLLAADTIFGLALDMSSYLFRTHHYYPNFHIPISFYLQTAYTNGIVALFIFLIYRGKNWARWVASCVIVLATIVAPFMQVGHLPWVFYFNTSICLTAVVALFQRSSNEWYKGSKKILSEPAAAI